MDEKKRKLRIGPITSLAGIADEMRKVYRAARRGDISPEAGTKFIYMLTHQRSIIEAIAAEGKSVIAKLRRSNDWRDLGALKREMIDIWVIQRNYLLKNIVKDVESQKLEAQQ
jgi:ribosome maturation protein Sdo1